MDNQIVIPHSWRLVNESFIIGIKPDVAVHRSIMVILLLCAPPVTITLHLTMIYLLFISSKRSKYANIFYKLVLTVSFVVIYWSGYFFYQGWCQLLGYSLFGDLGNIIIASIAQYLFYVCINMNLLIAVNRFSAVVLCHMYDHIFSTGKGVLYIAAIFLASAAQNIPGFIFSMKYYSELGTFAYLNKPPEDFLRFSIFIEMVCVYAVHAAIFVLYAWSFLSYKKMTGMSAHHKKERRLLIQAIISGSPCFVLMTCHHMIHFPLLEVLAGELCVGIDPVVYMWFNKDIRSDFLDIIGVKNWTSSIKKRLTSQVNNTETLNPNSMSGTAKNGRATLPPLAHLQLPDELNQ